MNNLMNHEPQDEINIDLPNQEVICELSEAKLLYQVWPAKNRFLFWGRVMIGPTNDFGPNLCAWLLLLGLPGAYFNHTFKILWQENPIILIMNILLFSTSMCFFILTTITDPGIIPRRSVQEQTDNLMPKYTEQGNQIAHKFCDTCKIYRPPRCSHCRECDSCVLILDHHCPFVNNCVGKRNYRFFFSFICSIFALGASSILGLLVCSKAQGQTDTYERIINVIFLVNHFFFYVILIITGCVSIGLFGFFCFHIFLIISGKTTREQLRDIDNQHEEQEIDWIKSSQPLFNPRQMVNIIQNF